MPARHCSPTPNSPRRPDTIRLKLLKIGALVKIALQWPRPVPTPGNGGSSPHDWLWPAAPPPDRRRSGLLATYLGEDAGRRVHAGAVQRGSIEKLRAVIWYADIRGFTSIGDAAPGPVVIDPLNDVFEILTLALRTRRGQVLKFIGDGMLATFSFEEADRDETCRRALDAATEAMQKLEVLNSARAAAGVPVASVDLALHIGEVLYGNVGATDRLDFTIIGPAVNEATRIEALCEPLGRSVLISPEFAAIAVDSGCRLEPLGLHALRGVREPKEIFALDVSAGA